MNGVQILYPLFLRLVSAIPSDSLKAIDERFFGTDREGIVTAVMIGLRVSSNKQVHPIFIEYIDGCAVGIAVARSTASEFVNDLKLHGGTKHLEVSHDIDDVLLIQIHNYLTNSAGIFKG